MPPQTKENFELEKEEGFDTRHPLYNGFWKRSIPYVHKELAVDNHDEPHLKRKHAILEKHPEIEKLYGTEFSTVYIILASTSVQMFFAYLFGRVLTDWNWSMVAFAYLVGGTISALFGCLIHECSHNLLHPNPLVNRIFALIVNTGIPFPISASFRRYHLIHHAYQGVEDKDPDLPMKWEYKFIRGSSLLKTIWVFCYAGLYVIRGAAMLKPLSFWEYMNIAYIITVDILVYTFWGPRALLYLALSLWLGYGLHPGAAHFVQEHYTFEDGQETYSYYGILNKFYINIGYHNEHHDFTQIPWNKLPKIKEIAPEFYDGLACHTSWVYMHFLFIFSDKMGPISRLKRSSEDFNRSRKLLSSKKKL
ncbi:hypothetical protein K502DRAFT_322563 [Neoconidiobolus thromboides FSU 785]|nr:hypothetical protein K502DRAFT_322563 [Neoconidiobolus thromboides FSU 785]